MQGGRLSVQVDERTTVLTGPAVLLDARGLTDHAMIRGYATPWYPGGFTWVIPNKYRVTGKGSGYVFIYTHQVFRITDKQGTVTVTKGGAGVTRSP